jgi:antitoxin component of RelBE/YafQ-DinJ toxin-antitoxin module
MNEDDVLQEIKKTVKEINEVLGLPSTTMVRLLLNYFRWDKDILTGKIKILIY